MNLKVKTILPILVVKLRHHPLKSYSHRAVILASLADGTSKIHDMLFSQDVLSSINACRALGANITKKMIIWK